MKLNILAILFGIIVGYLIVAKIDKPPLVVHDNKIMPISHAVAQQSLTDNPHRLTTQHIAQ